MNNIDSNGYAQPNVYYFEIVKQRKDGKMGMRECVSLKTRREGNGDRR
jgi:hypothetical protein